jgi:hypothetical protein
MSTRSEKHEKFFVRGIDSRANQRVTEALIANGKTPEEHQLQVDYHGRKLMVYQVSRELAEGFLLFQRANFVSKNKGDFIVYHRFGDQALMEWQPHRRRAKLLGQMREAIETITPASNLATT